MEQDVLEILKNSISEILVGLYDAVRIVELGTHQQFVLTPDGTLMKQDIQCHEFWQKCSPCTNCVSHRAQATMCTEEKVEVFGDKIYLVVGMPISTGQYCLEIVKDITNLIASKDEILNQYEFLRQQLEQLAQEAYVDGLTGVWNRRYFDDKFPALLNRAAQLDKSMALLMIDIDHFKRVNDTYGHVNGDVVLRQVAKVLQQGVRGHDKVCRYGGEEFAVILYDVPQDVAIRVAERMRENVANLDILMQNQTIRVTISIGLAFNHGHPTGDNIIRTADSQLYAAKGAGRNQVKW